MKLFTAILLIISPFILYKAEYATAASCRCYVYDSSINDAVDTGCNNVPANPDKTCSGPGTCTYYAFDNCKIGTGVDKSCSKDEDCAQNLGTAVCVSSKCYLDDLALQEFQRTDAVFLGTQVKLTQPKMSIRIPGVSFSNIQDTLDKDGYIRIPYLAEYIVAIYKFAIGAASILAAIVIILNGFRIVVSAGGDEKNAAMKQVGQALTGLFILWGSYVLFYTINPELVQFKALKVKYIEPVPLEEEEDVTTTTAPPATIEPAVIPGVITKAGVQVANTVMLDLKMAADLLKSKNIKLYLTSGYRSPDEQIALIKENCQNAPGSTTCNPKPGKPTTCILKDNDPNNCPHTTGRAVDVWGMIDGKKCVLQAQCKSNPSSDPCRQNECQAAIIEAMKAVGFCNLSSEAWHFEKPKMSERCNFN